ncbi:MAG: hypothetical protein GF409_02480 [Candidatus Omnitrophica bacterium]|nr:hypothetical protein [Candidatus Omnitrophota bacterium]
MLSNSKNISHLTGLILLMLSCSGCQTLKAPESPQRMWTPPEWEKSSRSMDTVWGSIRAKSREIKGSLTLYQLIGVALRNNPDTRRAWEQARAAEADIKQAQGESYPQISGEAEFAKEKNVTHRQSDKKNLRRFGGKLNATYLILDFGGRSADIEEATQLTLEANFLFNRSVQDLFLDTATAYYTYYSSKSAVEAAEADVENAKTSFEAAKIKLTSGLGVKLDVLQAKSDYENALFALEEARAQRQQAKADLAEVLGISSDSDLEIKEPSSELPDNVKQEDVSELIEAALQQRPDIAAARARLRATEARVKSANSDLWPKLNLGGEMGKTWYQYFGVNEAETVHNEYSGNVNVEWDIFDGFSNLARRRKASAEARSERENLISQELAASADVWTKYFNYKTSVRKRKFSRASYESSAESYDLALEGYRAGIKNILDLLEAQRSLSDARSRLIRSERDMFVALAELVHATGAIGIEGHEVATGVKSRNKPQKK